jgi:hypothetical protein
MSYAYIVNTVPHRPSALRWEVCHKDMETLPQEGLKKTSQDLSDERETGSSRDSSPSKKKMAAFCAAAPCSLVEVDRRFRGAYCLHHQGDELSEYYKSKAPQRD